MKSNRLFRRWYNATRKYRKLQTRLQQSSSDAVVKKLHRQLAQLRRRILTMNRKWKLGMASSVLLAWLSYSPRAVGQNFPATFDLSALNGTTGYTINGVDADDESGISVSSAGDVNGDGIDDLIIGASEADPNGNTNAGASYVVFGQTSGFTASLELADLDGTNGFVLNGIDGFDRSGESVSSAGDINGDGIDDLIVGASSANPNGNRDAGESYVVFGQSSGFAASLDLSDLDGTNGFAINGIDADDFSGESVSSAGDINGDGLDDLIIGADGADPNGNFYAGESYVVFGQSAGFADSLDLSDLDGSNGFAINGIDFFDYSGQSVSSAGDVNGDGLDDIIIGAPDADPNGNEAAGESYVVFGQSSGFAASLDLSDLDGSNGLVINGIDGGDESGTSVSSAGDINGDGIDDLIIGAPGADPNGNDAAGESYVVFGQSSGFAAFLDLSDLDGTNGFTLNGIDAYNNTGQSVSSAGDIDGDGIDDLIVEASFADPNGNTSAGESYVVFGRRADGSSSGFAASFELSDLDGTNGLVLKGIDEFDYSGQSVSAAGDVNGDGLDDIIIGAKRADPNGNDAAGESYVVFGNRAPQVVIANPVPKLDLGFGSKAINLDSLFEDVDALTYQVNQTSGTSSFNFSQNDSLLTLSETAEARADTASFTLTASDNRPGSDPATITLEVALLNQAPTVVTPLSGLVLPADFSSERIDLLPVFSDNNNDRLTLSVSSNNTDLINPVLDGNQLVITNSSSGTGIAAVTVTAADGRGESVSEVFTVTIVSNDPPVVNQPLPDLQLARDFAPRSVSLAEYFTDPNDDALTYTAVATDTAVVRAGIAAGDLVLEPGSRASGAATITVTATDEIGESVSEVFTVTVVSNDPPVVIQPLPDLQLTRDFAPRSVSLAEYFTDPNDDALTYAAVATDTAVVRAGIAAGDLVLEPGSRASGSSTITVTASDGNGNSVSEVFAVSIITNDPPVVNQPLPDLQLARNFASRTVTLAEYFTDPNDDALTFTAFSSNEEVVTTAVRADTLQLTEAGTGAASITVTASDGEEAVSTGLLVTVSPVARENNDPVVDSRLADLTLTPGFGSEQVNLAEVFADPDGDSLTYSFTLADENVATASLNGTTLTLNEAGVGSTAIIIISSDGNGGTAATSFLLTVQVPNSAPVVNQGIADQTATVESEFNFTIPTDVFTDSNGDELTLTVGDLPGWLSFSGNTFTGTPSYPDDFTDPVTIEVTATDPDGESVTTSFILTVELPTGLGDETAAGIRLYPNPATAAAVTLEVTPNWLGGTLEIVSASGKVLEQRTISQAITTLKLADYKQGLYLFRLQHEGAQQTIRLLK